MLKAGGAHGGMLVLIVRNIQAASRRQDKADGVTVTEVATTEMFCPGDLESGIASRETVESAAGPDPTRSEPLSSLDPASLCGMATEQSKANKASAARTEQLSANIIAKLPV